MTYLILLDGYRVDQFDNPYLLNKREKEDWARGWAKWMGVSSAGVRIRVGKYYG